MRYYQAQDTFIAGLPDGTQHLVTKGEARPETDELVKRDLAAKSPDRPSLFRLLDQGSEPPKAKPAARRAAKSDG